MEELRWWLYALSYLEGCRIPARMTKANDDMDFVVYLENSTRHLDSWGFLSLELDSRKCHVHPGMQRLLFRVKMRFTHEVTGGISCHIYM